MEVRPGGLEIQEQLLDLFRRFDGDRGGKQMLALPDVADEHRLADQPQRELRIVAPDLSVKGRIAMDEVDRKAELAREEITRRVDVGHEQLRRDRTEDGLACSLASLERSGLLDLVRCPMARLRRSNPALAAGYCPRHG